MQIPGPRTLQREAILLRLAALLVLGLGCSLLGRTPTPTSLPQAPTAEPSGPATETAQPPPPTETPAPAGLEVTCDRVHFWLDYSVARDARCERIPAAQGAEDLAPWEVGPEYTRITLEGYALADTFHVPRMYVYPLGDRTAIREVAAQTIARMQEFLDARPTVFDEPVPFMPPANAAQILLAQVRYVDFHQGRGVRFVTLYGQALRVINNDELFYTFQGLTLDGSSYVAVVLPVSHPSLAESGEIPEDQLDAFIETFTEYIDETEHALEAEAPASFTPDLGVLDEMVRSIEVR